MDGVFGKETILVATSFWVAFRAYIAGVIVGALLTTAGFGIIFGATGWDFVSFATVGIFTLSLPLTLLSIAFRRTAASSLSGAMLIGCVNGLISSALFVMVAGPVAWLVMLPVGGIGGATFWFVRHKSGSDRQ